ncbi:MAG: S9 family peptidase [Proteobacteria bacterium]|nr:S9 family peptidase [Pseudomonadota bacterium]
MLAIKRPSVLGTAVLLAWSVHAYADRLFDIDTYLAIKSVSSITVSPDGEYLAYTQSHRDLEKDTWQSAVWMQPTAGGEPVRMSAAGTGAWSPKWSPDNRYLALLSDRKDGRTQVWLLDRRGGDAQALTEFKQGVRSYEWSPDGTRMLLLIKDPSPADLDEEKRPNPRPYVIDRLQFKRDYVGYLDNRRTHVHVIEVADRKVRQVTFGDYDDGQPTWSPDGKHIVFVSNRTAWPDANRNTDLWRVDVSEDDAQPEQLTDAQYADSNPVFSPDGKRMAYTSNVSDGLPVYAIPQLTILDVGTGESQLVESLAEMQVWGLRFSADGHSIFAMAEYRGEQQLVKVDVESGAIERVIAGENVVREFEVSRDGQVYAVVSRPQSTAEIFSIDERGLQRFSAINRDLMAGITTGAVEKHTFQVEDGTDIDTFVVFPPGYEDGKRYPGVLHIHGGPWGQWDWRFNFVSQLFAAQGYVVIMPNFRGSWGYGQAFTDALVGKWGDIDYRDSMDAMDFAIEKGWVDGDRMAVYGWSWGGFLTNHVITKTNRFKAAISGASETLVVANYGHDEWQRLWAEEPGLPWLEGNRELWDKVSPFYSLDKVTTPTLVVGGEDDWNMPILNSEQLYLVLRRRGVPTQLVVYPGQGHSLSVPSYERDLYERYLDWFDKYLIE